MTTLDITGRWDFNQSWLTEMPMGIGRFENFEQIKYNILEKIRDGREVISLGGNLCKIQGSQVINYWYGDTETIILGTELYVNPQNLTVTMTGKNPEYRGRPPYASELYDDILKDKHKSLRLTSDDTLSDEGYDLWKRMFKMGHKISVYDREQSGKTFSTFDSVEQMDQYFAHGDPSFKRYQYVISESGVMISETKSLFNTRRYRELIPGLL